MTTKPLTYAAELARMQNFSYFNSPDHNTTLTNVASERGICLSPGFLNDHTGEFVWIPFDCEEKMPCALYTHKSESRKLVLKATPHILPELLCLMDREES